MRFFTTLTILISLAAGSAHSQEQLRDIDTRPEIVKALDGNWIMTGDVMGKPVTYNMRAEATLQNTFTEMHMKDVQVPAKYEARVFLGYDKESQTVIAHWMDSFGGKYSVPHASGHINGNTIQFIFPYASGPFRDTLTYSPEATSWVFEIEASKPDGTWKHFARYDIRRN
ncbi:DUF1579 family protein [Undibacterium terreum]|uniref:DUF1579 domain-containing protein n=1 Tax=Undibacterium terreum TaxID=1224302 RepID=A0A916XDK4_9BURK|nr:DUF1579 family protein [Undibacterium terreum]GGC65772.1 hypothetical protein GCM10011396_10990 [Undibacterium terreum]